MMRSGAADCWSRCSSSTRFRSVKAVQPETKLSLTTFFLWAEEEEETTFGVIKNSVPYFLHLGVLSESAADRWGRGELFLQRIKTTSSFYNSLAHITDHSSWKMWVVTSVPLCSLCCFAFFRRYIAKYTLQLCLKCRIVILRKFSESDI